MATPKQIRGVMQVEGLTNDQVKSHLQVDDLPYLSNLQFINFNSLSQRNLFNLSVYSLNFAFA